LNMSEERVLDSYRQLLAGYPVLDEQLFELEKLHQRWVAKFQKEKNFHDEELEDNIQSIDNEISEKVGELARLCDYINTSPFKEKCYSSLKDEFGTMNGFDSFPENAEEFLDMVFDVPLQIGELLTDRATLTLSLTFPKLMGSDVHLEEEIEITLDMLKDDNNKLDDISARWKNEAGTIQFTIDGNVSNPVHSSQEVGKYLGALMKGSEANLRSHREEILSALEHGKVVMCTLNNQL